MEDALSSRPWISNFYVLVMRGGTFVQPPSLSIPSRCDFAFFSDEKRERDSPILHGFLH